MCMYKFIIIYIIISSISLIIAEEQPIKELYFQEYIQGKEEGTKDGKRGLPSGATCVGCLFGPIGVIISAGSCSESVPNKYSAKINLQSDAYKIGYKEGYRNGEKDKNLKSALLGFGITLISTCIIVAIK